MKHERKFSLKKALVCLLLLALVPISALADFAATVKSSTMRVYSTNNTGWVYYLGSLKKGTQVTVTAVKGHREERLAGRRVIYFDCCISDSFREKTVCLRYDIADHCWYLYKA